MKNKIINLIKTLRHPLIALRIWRAERAAAARLGNTKRLYPGCEGAMNVWPPVSGTTVGYEVDAPAPTAIRWGTDGVLQSPTPSGTGADTYATVNRCSQKEKNENIYLPNGSGIEAMRVRLKHGGTWAVVVRDNQQVTWPKIGGTVSVVDMQGHFGTLGLTYTAKVIDNDYEAALKAPGERTLLVEKLTLIETGSGGAQS